MAKRESRASRRERYAREKERDLIGWSFRTRRANARRRGKYWSLTLEEFTEFCYLTELLTNSGTKSKSYTVDRIRNEFGYYVGNIQRMENRDNVRKRHLKYDWETRTVRVVAYQEDTEHYPF